MVSELWFEVEEARFDSVKVVSVFRFTGRSRRFSVWPTRFDENKKSYCFRFVRSNGSSRGIDEKGFLSFRFVEVRQGLKET